MRDEEGESTEAATLRDDKGESTDEETLCDDDFELLLPASTDELTESFGLEAVDLRAKQLITTKVENRYS